MSLKPLVLAALLALPISAALPVERAEAASDRTLVAACVKAFPRNKEGCKCLPRFTKRMKAPDRTYLLRSLRKGTPIGVVAPRGANMIGVSGLVVQLRDGARC